MAHMAVVFWCATLKVGYPRVTRGPRCPLLLLHCTEQLQRACMQGGAFLSLCTPAIKVNSLISEPSAANHILTFKRRFKTSGHLKEVWNQLWRILLQQARTRQAVDVMAALLHCSLPADGGAVMNASKVVVPVWMCLPFPQVTALFWEIILHLPWRICLALKFFAQVECICVPGIRYGCILEAAYERKQYV